MSQSDDTRHDRNWRIDDLIRAGLASADRERQRRDRVEMEQTLGIGIQTAASLAPVESLDNDKS